MVVCVVVVVVAGGYLARATVKARDERAAVSPGPRHETARVTGPRLVFRTTNRGAANGLVSVLPLARLSGRRSVIGPDCDRVDANRFESVCLRTRRGVVTTFEAQMYDARGHETAHWPLPGIPSRTRLSPSGRLVADTTFVTGHSYMQVGFSTATEIRRVGGASYGNVEKFALLVGGRRITASDRNIWGVTFSKDDNTFYATAASGGKTWLVRGNLADRTLTSVRENAECPSLSPSEQLVAYKKRVPAGSTHWALAVLDLTSGHETVLGEKRSVDDQVEWLDEHTLLYGLPRAGQTGVTDVWQIGTSVGAQPRRVINDAWSPAVVR
jgi:hypothetical protein